MTRASLPNPSPPRLPGLDALRCLALALVLYRHVASNYAPLDLPVHVAGLDSGQVGVALFCVLSGFLALDGRRAPWPWLVARLARIFPPLWLVTALSVAGALVTAYKPVVPKYLALQALGLGYFVPPAFRLNVVVWFITLILACYMLALVARVLGAGAGPAWGALGASALLLVAVPDTITTHLVGFAAGMAMRRTTVAGRMGLPGWAVPALATGAWLADSHFGYAALAALGLVAAHAVPLARGWRPVAWIARHAYEIFLLHGLVLVTLAHVLRLPVAVAVPLLLTATALAAIPLKHAADRLAAPILDGRPRAQSSWK